MSEQVFALNFSEWEPDHPGFDRYLEDTIIVDWQTPAVMDCARTLVEGVPGGSEQIEAVFTFVRDEISQSLDVETDALPCNASEVLQAGTGLSYAKSHLLAALLRARGVPAGFGYQRIRDDKTASGYALHGFVVSWFSEILRWVALDPRGNTPLLRSEFCTDWPPNLAHWPDVEEGSMVFSSVFSRPLKRVVELLDRGEKLGRVRRHLPAEIQSF